MTSANEIIPKKGTNDNRGNASDDEKNGSKQCQGIKKQCRTLNTENNNKYRPAKKEWINTQKWRMSNTNTANMQNRIKELAGGKVSQPRGFIKNQRKDHLIIEKYCKCGVDTSKNFFTIRERNRRWKIGNVQKYDKMK